MSTAPSVTKLKADLQSWLPHAIVEALVDAYTEIKQNFFLGKHEPAELNAGKLCEVLYRVLEIEAGGGKYTPLGVSIQPFDGKCRQMEQAQANDSVRFHLPRLAIAAYNIRNKRGVGHVGGDVNPNRADATLVATAADWIMAELIRLHYGCGLNEAQDWVDGLVQRRLPLVYQINGMRRVLNPALSFTEKTLVLLAEEFPGGVSEKDLLSWVEHSNGSVYRRDVLKKLHKQKLIEYREGICSALPPGVQLVESKYASWLRSAH